MKRFARLTALFAGFVLAAAAHGQASPPGGAGQAAANAPPGPPLYQVEVIVFANNGADPNEEVFPLVAPPAPQPELEPEPPPSNVFDAAQSLGLPDETGALAPDGGALPADDSGGAAPAAGPEASSTAAPSGPSASAAPGTPAAGTAAASAQGADAAGADAGDSAAPAPEPLIGPSGYRIVDASGLKLAAAYAKLERLDAYRPLLHAAWIQPALAEDRAPAIAMADLGTLNPTGTIRFYMSRYLHVNVDLTYRPTAAQAAALETAEAQRQAQPTQGAGAGATPAGAAGGAPAGAAGEFSGTPPAGTPAFDGISGAESGPLEEISLGPKLLMKTSRRVSAGDVQYFDHPYFGLIVVITPYEPPQTQPVPTAVPPAA